MIPTDLQFQAVAEGLQTMLANGLLFGLMIAMVAIFVANRVVRHVWDIFRDGMHHAGFTDYPDGTNYDDGGPE